MSGPLTALLGIGVFLFGCIGFGEVEGNSNQSVPIALYETLQLFAFNADTDHLKSGWLLAATICTIALAVIVASKGIALLFHGSYVSIFLQFIASDHIIICGLGRVGRQLIEDLVQQGDQRTIVVVEPDDENANLAWARDQGALVVIGDSTKRENLEEAGVHRAGELFIATGSDACNVECAIEVREALRSPGRLEHFMARVSGFIKPRAPLRCYVHILDRDLAEIVRARTGDFEESVNSNLAGNSSRMRSATALNVQVFSALERTARRLLEDIATSSFAGHSMRPVGDDEVAHYVMLGFGDFGQTLALRLAELAHFENGKRLRLTIVDRDIQSKAEAFIARHPRFGPALGQIAPWDFEPAADSWSSHRYRPTNAAAQSQPWAIEYACNAQYVEYCEATDDNFLRGMIASFDKQGTKPAVLVCFEDDRQNFALAERMRSKLATLQRKYPIFVWIPRQRELSQLLLDQRNKPPSQTKLCTLIPFGQCYGSVAYTEVTKSWSEWLARRLQLVWMDRQKPHWEQVVADFQNALLAEDAAGVVACLVDKDLRRIADAAWTGTNEWARASNRSAAIHTVLKAAALQLEIVDQEANESPTAGDNGIAIDLAPMHEPLCRMEHYRWVAERLLSGWSYNEVSDDETKTRWQIRPWEGLESPPNHVVAKAEREGKKLDEKNKDARIIQLVACLIKSRILESKPVGISS